MKKVLLFACGFLVLSFGMPGFPAAGGTGPRRGLAGMAGASGADRQKKNRMATAEQPGMDAGKRLAAYEKQRKLNQESIFKNLPWQFIGPTNISGRMTDVAVVSPKGKNYTIYVGTASGGVWKSINEGTSWYPVFQDEASTAIGDIAIDPNDQETIWVGTGEDNIFRSSNAGTGVYRSKDGGKTWTHMGLSNSYTISRILVHPSNPDIVYVAVSGSEWTTNPNRGLYKTTDGGKSWNKILFVNEMTGIIDLVMDPSNPDQLYAASWQRVRKKWNDPRNEDGYAGSGLFRTSDGGQHWEAIDNGLPPARYRGRMGIDIARSKPGTLYAFVDNYEIYEKAAQPDEKDAYGRPHGKPILGATLFRSDDRGSNWRQVSDTGSYMRNLSGTYGWVFGQVRVDPNNENKVFVMGLSLNISTDSGKTFKEAEGIHADHHGLWIDPLNSNYLVNVNDGGLTVSYDGGTTFRTFADRIPVSQHFTVAIDMASPFHVYTSIQDHGSFRGIVDLSEGRNHIHAVAFEQAPGWEGNHHAIDPTDPNTVYSAGFYGSIARNDMAKGEHTDILPKPGKNEPRYRAQWLAPFIISPHNPRILYYGNNFLFRSLDRGDKWEKLSPDLTFNDSMKSGDIPYQTIFTISESPLAFGLIYAGTDDGRLHLTRDDGLHWTEISKGLAPGKWISRVVASAYDKATVYAAQNGKRDDEFNAYLFKSEDYGNTWKNISSNLPAGPVNVIQEDPKNKHILYAGTDWGVYVSLDRGQSWISLPCNIPTTYVHDLVIHPRDNIMVAATHGRGMYALDVSVIQQMAGGLLAKDLAFLDIDSGIVSQNHGSYGRYAIRNINFPFCLKQPSDYTLIISDSANQQVWKYAKKGDAGLNMVEWNLSVDKDTAAQSREREHLETVNPGMYRLTLETPLGKIERTIKVIENTAKEEDFKGEMEERD